MKTYSGSTLASLLPWLFGALILFFLAACALTPGAQTANTPDSESVDIGYGSVDKDHVVGSVATIRSEDHPERNYASLAEMMRDRVPGVLVTELAGGGLRVRIRGASTSFQSSEEPLFVVDGMIVTAGGQSLADMNPNTVESITVLKDAGATAIYGSRGANGVILIKTKRELP